MAEVAELSVREEGTGQVADLVKVTPVARSPSGRAAIMILIHGYNISEGRARKVYSMFLRALESGSGTPIALPIYEFMWPGDEANRILSALSYASKIDIALEAGRRLGEYLDSSNGPSGTPIDVHVVAHSLGNRVLLAMLGQLASSRKVIIRSVTMMAAAVPVEMVAFPGPFFNACMVPRQSLVLHSIADLILGAVFPEGETLHGDSFLPSAVGWLGNPRTNWSAHQAYNTFGHGDYWIKPGPPGEVLELLGMGPTRQTNSAGAPSRRTSTRTPSGSSTAGSS